MDSFVTIKYDVQAELIVQKSKFICNLIKVNSKQEAEEKIKEIKKKYFDARHNCIAYRVIENESIIEKSNDDGEPSGTAGAPMLNIIQKNDLLNVLVIVTRYFGGILLGTGGLVRAYSDSTILALNNAEIIERCIGIELEAKLLYQDFENFKYYCKKNNIKIVDYNFSDIIVCKIQVEEHRNMHLFEDFKLKNINLTDLKIVSKKIIDKSIIN